MVGPAVHFSNRLDNKPNTESMWDYDLYHRAQLRRRRSSWQEEHNELYPYAPRRSAAAHTMTKATEQRTSSLFVKIQVLASE